jgi:hypothetical protein
MSEMSASLLNAERTHQASSEISFRRLAGSTVGIGTQALFAVTVVGLFSFLRYGVTRSSGSWMLIDCLLALQFAIPHSLLLHPRTRSALKRWVPSEFYGAFFCVCTCISLGLIFAFWQQTTTILWDLDGVAANLVVGCFLLSWASMLYSIHLTGLGFQTGWTQWMHWYQHKKMPRRDFVPRGAYRFLRHPVYLSFLGLIWFTPTMTLDHAVLTGIWTVYIGVGSVLKDRRIAFYLGEQYLSYMRMVSGYPLIPFGPLAKLRSSSTNSAPPAQT